MNTPIWGYDHIVSTGPVALARTRHITNPSIQNILRGHIFDLWCPRAYGAGTLRMGARICNHKFYCGKMHTSLGIILFFVVGWSDVKSRFNKKFYKFFICFCVVTENDNNNISL